MSISKKSISNKIISEKSISEKSISEKGISETSISAKSISTKSREHRVGLGVGHVVKFKCIQILTCHNNTRGRIVGNGIGLSYSIST